MAARWEEAKPLLLGAADKAGIDAGILAQIAFFESSGFNSEARPISSNPTLNKQRQFDGVMALSTGHGYGQFLDGSWKDMMNQFGEKYGVKGAGDFNKVQANSYRKDKLLQAAMLAEFTKLNIDIGKKIGGNNDSANVYALHNLGGGDARKFLRALKDAPNDSVSSVLKGAVISGNGSLYGDGSISIQNAYNNMADKMSAGDIYANEIRMLQKPRKN